MQKLRNAWCVCIPRYSRRFQPRLTSPDVDRFPRVEDQGLRAVYHALVSQMVDKVPVLLEGHLAYVALSRKCLDFLLRQLAFPTLGQL